MGEAAGEETEGKVEAGSGDGGACGVLLQQTLTILWKNKLLKLRQWRASLIGMAIPTVIFCVLLMIRAQIPVTSQAAGEALLQKEQGEHDEQLG